MNPACLVIKNARVLTFDGGEEEEACEADILIRDGVIEAIGSGLAHCAPNAECLDASGLIAIPGLINAHIHSPGNLLRGTLDGLPLEIFMLYEVPPRLSDANEEFGFG